MRSSVYADCVNYDEYVNDRQGSYEVFIDFFEAVEKMDVAIREKIHRRMPPSCRPQDFYDAYIALHYQKYGKCFLLDENSLRGR